MWLRNSSTQITDAEGHEDSKLLFSATNDNRARTIQRQKASSDRCLAVKRPTSPNPTLARQSRFWDSDSVNMTFSSALQPGCNVNEVYLMRRKASNSKVVVLARSSNVSKESSKSCNVTAACPRPWNHAWQESIRGRLGGSCREL